MTRFLLCILSVLCFMCGESYAKAYWHYETAEKDREQARLKLESMQNSSPAAGEVRIMKMVINSGKLEQQTVHASRSFSEKDLNRVSFILMQVRPNPHFVCRGSIAKRRRSIAICIARKSHLLQVLWSCCKRLKRQA